MAAYTVRTFRANGKWVKVTRDNINKTYFFARGYENEKGDVYVGDIQFKHMKNWTEAINCAIKIMEIP